MSEKSTLWKVLIFQYVTNQPPKANSAFHPSGVGKWVPASAGKAKAGMVHSVTGWMRGVQVKLWDPLRTRAIPERLRGAFMTRRYTNPRLPYLYCEWSLRVFLSLLILNAIGCLSCLWKITIDCSYMLPNWADTSVWCFHSSLPWPCCVHCKYSGQWAP